MTFKRLSSMHWFRFFLVVFLIGLNVSKQASVYALEENSIDEALEKGAAWIVERQLESGGWTENRDPGTTSLALSALTAHAKHLGLSPLDPDYAYSENIQAALDYIFSRAQRDPDSHFVHWGTGQIYVLGPALMAITSVETPDEVIDLEGSAVDGLTHFEVVEEVVNFIAEAQVKSGPGVGLWYYSHPTTTGDMSIAGWTTLGLSYAKEKFNIELPQSMLDYLDEGIDIVIWDDDPEHELYGGAGYTSDYSIETSYRYWINIHKVGHLLSMLELVGDDIDSPRVQAALSFIERHFYAPNSGASGTSYEYPYLVNDYIDVGWRGKDGVTNPSYNGALTIMKGLLAYGIDTINVDGVETDWQSVFEEVITQHQSDDGYWQSGGYPYSTSETYRIYYTSWAMMTLLRSVPSIAVTNVSMQCPPRGLLVTGSPITLTPIVSPSDATNQTILWESSNPLVASINDGVVTPLTIGTTTITATSEDSGLSAECIISIQTYEELVSEIIEDQTNSNVTVDDLLGAVLFTEQELRQEVVVKLVIKPLNEDEVTLNDKTLLEAYVRENIDDVNPKIVFIDISLFKLVGESEQKLTNSLIPIKITMLLDESLRDIDFEILRVHEGIVESLSYKYDEDTHMITFSTDKFSTYAFGYGEPQEIPETSDSTNPLKWLMLGFAILIFGYRKRLL